MAKRDNFYSISQKLSEFTANIQYDDLPLEVIQQAKMCILDSFANMLACGTKCEELVLSTIVNQFHRSDESTVYGLFKKTDCMDAALINGIMARMLDLDDGNLEARGHPGAVLIPAVFSLGENKHKSGTDILTSLIVGYEAYIRLGKAFNPLHRDRGFDTTSTVGVFAAALASARLLGLTPERIVWTLGTAGSLAGGLNEYVSDGTMTKNLHPGLAARNGILSARLAQAGVSGPKTIFEGRNGFIKAFVGDVDEENIINITERLGEYYGILSVYFKRHACMRRIHASVDAAILISEEKSIDPKAIDRIVVHTSSFVSQLDNSSPNTVVAAQASVPFCVAVALIYGKAGPDELSRENLNNPSIIDLTKKITLSVDAEFEKSWREDPHSPWSAEVEVFLLSGEKFARRVVFPKGDPQNSLSGEELEEKYDNLASLSITDNKRRLLKEKILNIESIQDMVDFYDDFL